MPLLPPVPAGQYRISSTANGYGYSQMCKIFLFFLVAAAGIRLVIVKLTTRRPTVVVPTRTFQETDIKRNQAPPVRDLRHYGASDRKDRKDQPPTIQPIYPWIAPPQALPGPYDPRLYPLPTIRRLSYDPSAHVPEHEATVSYSRRVSTNDIPTQQTIVNGSVTTSTKGWRRNQWVISGA